MKSYNQSYLQGKCLGNCAVEYGGQYKSIEVFQQAQCSGEIQSANNIGFFCLSHLKVNLTSVIMIGGGGNKCSQVDHGLAIRSGHFSLDFGADIYTSLYPAPKSYTLNLWVY